MLRTRRQVYHPPPPCGKRIAAPAQLALALIRSRLIAVRWNPCLAFQAWLGWLAFNGNPRVRLVLLSRVASRRGVTFASNDGATPTQTLQGARPFAAAHSYQCMSQLN
jgi:hypothetical protein